MNFGVMPNLEWTALSVEPGCRQAAMDPQIKLFGRILSVTPSHIGAGADAGVLNPTSVSPPSRQDGGDSVHRGAENKGVSEKLVSARSSSGDEFLLLFKKVAESCGGAAAPPPQQQQQFCEESEGAQSDELRDHSSTHSGGNNNNNSNDGKKPDKVVACPRCNSQETKFCYYNNYNVNQPRHFCKNCQRYWTAGGTLRNVPVGAGRRKSKTGNAQQQQRENDASPNCSSFQMDSGEFSCGLSSPRANKLSHPTRLPGQGSPLRSPGSTSPFGPDSSIAMSAPMYSLCQNGRLPFQSFNSCTQGFTTSGAEMSAVGSSDTAPALRGQRLICLPSPAGFVKDGTRPSFSEQVQGAANLNTVRFFNGEWPHGYTHDWDGNNHPHPISQGFTPVLTTYNTATTTPTPTPTPPSSWSPAWMGDPPWPANPPQPLQFTLGKRHRDTVDDMVVPAKSPRTENGTDSRSRWPWLPDRNAATELQQSRGTLKQLLHHPKVEPSSAACDPKDTFMSRLFKNTTAPRLVPFPVTT